MKLISLKPRICRGLAAAMLIGTSLSAPDRAGAQYNVQNSRFSKTHIHSRFESQPPAPVACRPRPEVERASAAEEYQDSDWGLDENETLMRAQQALMHNGGPRPQVTTIPSTYRIQGYRQVSGQNTQGGTAPVPRERSQEPPSQPPAPIERSEMFREVPYDDAATEYTYDDQYFEGEEWNDGRAEFDDQPCDQDYYQFDSCRDWCQTVFCQGNTSVQLGVVGFKNPANQGRDGSFGFQESVNFGTFLPFLPESGIGWQLGVRTIQANIASASFTAEQRNQTFFTSGFFRRRRVGLNAGFVFDMLRDNWYNDTNVGQVRAQFSWRFPQRHEWGYWFAAGDSADSSISPINPQQIDEWNPKELHAFFYRRRLCMHPCATAGLFAGFASGGDGLVGGNTFLPVNDNWAFQSSFVYLSPNESNAEGGFRHEVWNLSVALVWTLGRQCEARFAPMFDVADNGSFIVDRSVR